MWSAAYLHERELDPQEGGEHEHEEDPPGELQVALGLVVPEGGDAGEERLSLLAALGQHEEEGPDEGQVAEEELKVPQNAVGYGLLKERTV